MVRRLVPGIGHIRRFDRLTDQGVYLANPGSYVLITGGTKDTVAIGSDLAFNARSANVPSSEAGMSVDISCLPAEAIASKWVMAVWGLSCLSIALITHFCRAIRE